MCVLHVRLFSLAATHMQRHTKNQILVLILQLDLQEPSPNPFEQYCFVTHDLGLDGGDAVAIYLLANTQKKCTEKMSH